ncbi:thioredoxin domain-containing protein [Photobacterium minamisatsumaniensis]|uniref:thioredoxin domain-containing protein n=1 Tax=Photobacterium minamisatsumaniensis TaxID=2910233 RepID=UPI003D09C12B
MITILTALLTIAIFLPNLSQAGRPTPEEGVKYFNLKREVPNAPNIAKVFALSCPACAKINRLTGDIETLAGIKIYKIHAVFNESTKNDAKFYYTAVTQTGNQPSEKFMEAAFALYHSEILSEASQVDIESKYTILKNAKLNNYKDLTAAQKTDVNIQLLQAERFTQEANVYSIPSFIVKGKYLINLKAHTSVEDLAITIKYLNEMI